MNDAEKPRRRWIGRAARALGWVACIVVGVLALLAGLLHLPLVQRATTRVATREAGRRSPFREHAKGLEVENVGGTVSVRGTLPDDARLKIARDAGKSAPGAKKVIDLLEVAKK